MNEPSNTTATQVKRIHSLAAYYTTNAKTNSFNDDQL